MRIASRAGHALRWAFAFAAISMVACGVDTQGLLITGDDGGADDGTVDSGGDDAQATDGDDGGPLADAATEAATDATMPDATTDGTTTDAPSSGDASEGGAIDASADACQPGAVENCTNGVDDDCNGLVDCADPQCSQQGFSCAPAIPTGWSPVDYEGSNGGGACPGGWQDASAFVEGPGAASSCACACGAPLANGCERGTLSLSLGGGLLGGGACACMSNVPLASDGACDAVGSTIGGCGLTAPSNGSVTALPPSTVACSSTATLAPITYSSSGQTCALAAPSPGGGCNGNGACEPAAGPGVVCIAHTGQVACPAGYTTSHTIYAPGDVVDGRACGTCSCTSTPSGCSNPQLALYNDSKCTTGAATVPVNGSCSALNGNPSGDSYFLYSATPTGGSCTGPATVAASGGLALNDPVTVCCP